MGLAKVHCGATPPSVMVLFSFKICFVFSHFLVSHIFLFFQKWQNQQPAYASTAPIFLGLLALASVLILAF